MARPIRIEFAGAIYHVTARGNERRRVFRRDEDREVFLATLGEAVALHELRVHTYCLMPNHYHLVVETPRGNLSRALGWLQTTYTIRFNRRYRRSGHLFQGRFKAHLVEADAYAQGLLRYVHLNPVRSREKRAPIAGERWRALSEYRWSSHRAYAGLAEPEPWLSLNWLVFFGGERVAARKAYRAYLREAFGRAVANPWEQLRGGLVLGTDALWAKVTQLAQGKLGAEERRWERREISAAAVRNEAARLAAQEPDRRLQVWLRVVLGGERRIDVARELGYCDGSAITQLLKRLNPHDVFDSELGKQMQAYRKKLASSVKS
jgi:REP element-mobilizing transposase RayT